MIVGVAGAEYSHRGLVEGYDAKTGNHLWRLYTIPAKGEPGSETWDGDSALTGEPSADTFVGWRSFSAQNDKSMW